MRIHVAAVVGRSGTGKTTTMEFLIRDLSRRGLRVGAVKRIHDPAFSIDTRGKDTDRLSRAGAGVVASSADGQIAFIKMVSPAEDYYLREICARMRLEGIQVVLLEGFHSVVARSRSIPKIVTARDESDLSEMLSISGNPVIAITGIVGDKAAQKNRGKTPILSLKRHGPQLTALLLSSLGLETKQRSGRRETKISI